MIQLNIDDKVIINGRIYNIEYSKWDNGKLQGHRAILRLLNQKELSEELIKQQNEN